jgi:integrase
MLKLLFFTAVRVSELTNIRVEDVDLGACKIFIEQGKGAKDRYILFPESFRTTAPALLVASRWRVSRYSLYGGRVRCIILSRADQMC